MLNRIKELESKARLLETGPVERAAMFKLAGRQAESFLDTLSEANTYTANSGQSDILETMFAEQAGGFEKLLRVFHSAVDDVGINAASGGHMGYIPGGGLYPSALGDFLADVGNYYAGVNFASPGAVKMEQQLIRWMCDLVGFPATAGGDLTSGGSIANLTAIVTARETMGIKARDVENSCVYLTEATHHCVDKALRAAGLAECPKRIVPMDACFRMDPATLQTMIERDKSEGFRPWLITASAGTTDTGAVDPIEAIAGLSKQHGIWLHVDAAYGGFFMLCEEGRQVLNGIEHAHSVVLDPHKGMFLPYGSGALLVRDVSWLAASQAYHAGYMQDAKEGEEQYSPADLSLELTRPFRGLRFWLPLKLYGVATFRAALTEKIYLARYFYAQMSQLPNWEMGPYPELSVVTFRFMPRHENTDMFNQQLLNAVMEDGKVFISSTRINGVFVIRLAVLHFRTHIEHVDYVLDFLIRKAAELNV